MNSYFTELQQHGVHLFYTFYMIKKQLLIIVFTPFRIFFQIVTQPAILYLLAGGVVLRVILGNVML